MHLNANTFIAVVCSDGTTLTASSQQPHSQGSPSICIDTRGTAACIAEIGERLAWLISAVRSSPYAREVAYSRPYIDGIQIGHVTYEETPKVMYMCTIGVNIRRGDRVTETTNGQCWHNLFGSPVVVEGFPIPRRPEEHSAGIEIPLNIMAALTQTRKVHNFAGKTLLKGFSDMLIPMKYSQGMVTWHLVHSKNGERVSYLESDNFETVDIQTAELEKSRHILGWCPEMKTYAGMLSLITLLPELVLTLCKARWMRVIASKIRGCPDLLIAVPSLMPCYHPDISSWEVRLSV